VRRRRQRQMWRRDRSAGAVAQWALTRQNACVPRAALEGAVCDGRDGFVRVCPVVGSVGHHPPRPVVAPQVALARQDPTPITLTVDAQQGTVVQWWYAPDPAGESVCRTRAWDDPVAYVYANVRLGAEARQWIEAGALQARYPGIAVRQGHLCVDGHPPAGPQLRGFPLAPWLPLDPGRHDVAVTLVTTTGAVATAAPYAVDVHLLLSGVE